MESSVTSTETRSSMIIEPISMVAVECPCLLQGVRRMCLGGTMTCAVIVVSAELWSTQGNRALTRDLSLFKAWSTEIGRTEKTQADTVQVVAECMFLVPSVLAEPSGQQ